MGGVSAYNNKGHSEVEGNDVEDRLAKEAIVEAKDLEEETSVVTVQDIKRHARASTVYSSIENRLQ